METKEKKLNMPVFHPSYQIAIHSLVRTHRVGVETNKNGNQMHTFGSIARDSLLIALELEGHSVQ